MPAYDRVASAKDCAQQIASLYSSKISNVERDNLVKELYSPSAIWSDPLTQAKGVGAIIANYRSLSGLASEAELKILDWTINNDSSGFVLRFDAEAIYKIRFTPLVVKYRQWSVIHFDNETRMVKEHVDHWSVESLLSTIPIFGLLYLKLWRPMVGAVIHTLFKPRQLVPEWITGKKALITSSPAARTPTKVKAT
mmetsp:Transcript_45825/g.71804  ORF Transcript_45825/g.71804 Transcript_45825/m.71804 type:complete len:195 (-) Transcript_45825:870-1454(-)